MKNIWKWVLGIVVIVIVAATLFGLGFVWRTRMAASPFARDIPAPQVGRAPIQGGFPAERNGSTVQPRGGPWMQMRGFGRGPEPFHGGMFFGMFGGLIPLAVLLLLLYGAYRLGKDRSTPPPVTVVAPPTVAVPLPATHPCPACGSAVQDDWKHCPNCGEKQA